MLRDLIKSNFSTLCKNARVATRSFKKASVNGNDSTLIYFFIDVIITIKKS